MLPPRRSGCEPPQLYASSRPRRPRSADRPPGYPATVEAGPGIAGDPLEEGVGEDRLGAGTADAVDPWFDTSVRACVQALVPVRHGRVHEHRGHAAPAKTLFSTASRARRTVLSTIA